MEKKIQPQLPKMDDKKIKKIYMKTFSEDMANFYLAVEKKDKTWGTFKSSLEDKAVHTSKRLNYCTLFFMNTSDSIRALIKSSQQAYGFEDLINVELDGQFVPIEPNATFRKECRGRRQKIEYAGINFMDFLDEVLKALNRQPSLYYSIEGCQAIFDRLKKLATEVIILTHGYLQFISSKELLIKDEQKRVKVELALYEKQFPFIFSGVGVDKTQGEKRKLKDEGEGSLSSKPKFDK